MSRLICESPKSTCVTKIGGSPTGVADFTWPHCRSCNGAMQFLAQIQLAETGIDSLPDALALIFQCQNDPGMCDDWDADGGGNAVLVVRSGKDSVDPPAGETTLPQETSLILKDYDSSVDEETADDNYIDAVETDETVLGKLGGQPLWIQEDETPGCECGATMQFVALLEERNEMNFGGGGTGYVFVCHDCPDRAKFLWQS